MKLAIASTAALTMGLMAPGHCQTPAQRSIASTISGDMLRNLVVWAPADMRVGIVNEPVGALVLISAKGATPAAQYVRSENGLLPHEISRAIAASQTERLALPLVWRTVNAQTCPSLGKAIESFYSILESHLNKIPPLSAPPPKAPTDVIVLDGARYTIHFKVSNALMTIADLEPHEFDLHDESGELSRVVGQCANSVQPRTEVVEYYVEQ